jgi:outer membrane protein assembly factor BamB
VDGVVYIASLSGHLFAIDQQTGTEKWKFKSSMPIASLPAIADGVLYFVSSAGSLAALDIATGQPKWVFAAEYERKFEAKGLHGYPSAAQTIPDARDVFTSSPAVANGKVFFGSGDGNIYAVDAKSGILQWKFATRDVVHASPAVAGGIVYIGSWDGVLYALDATTGRKKWDYPTSKSWVNGTPAVRDGAV